MEFKINICSLCGEVIGSEDEEFCIACQTHETTPTNKGEPMIEDKNPVGLTDGKSITDLKALAYDIATEMGDLQEKFRPLEEKRKAVNIALNSAKAEAAKK